MIAVLFGYFEFYIAHMEITKLIRNMIVKKLVTALLLIFSTAVWAGDFKNGQIAYQKGDYPAARFSFERAAAKGNISAQFALYVMSSDATLSARVLPELPSLTTVSMDRDALEALDLYKQGLLHDQGQGTAVNHTKAFQLYQQAAVKGSPLAQFRLGEMLQKGDGIPVNFAEAARNYLLAAKQGHPSAQLNLGALHNSGLGVIQDFIEAHRYFKLAAAQGNASALYNLGVFYHKGIGVARDDAEAARYYKLAVSKGIVLAEQNLGVMYTNGEGVDKDYVEAVRLFKMAAAQGNDNAQHNLAFMYAQGKGIEQSLVKAHMWWNLAAATGNKSALKNRGIVANKMTPLQVVQAQGMARDCLADEFVGCN